MNNGIGKLKMYSGTRHTVANFIRLGIPMTRELMGNNEFKDEAFKHLDSLRHTALWFNENEHQAENLIIDAYVEAARIWDGTDSKADCKIWMFKVLMKILLGDTYMNFRQRLSNDLEQEHEVFSADKIPAIKKIPQNILINAISSLPVEARLVWTMLIFENFFYQEIAGLIGVSRNTVRSTIYQGYRLIRRDLFNYSMAGKMNLSVS